MAEAIDGFFDPVALAGSILLELHPKVHDWTSSAM
jgi:hypothetical protein